MTTHELARQLLAGPDVLACVIGQGALEGATIPLAKVEPTEGIAQKPSYRSQPNYLVKGIYAATDEEWEDDQRTLGKAVPLVVLS